MPARSTPDPPADGPGRMLDDALARLVLALTLAALLVALLGEPAAQRLRYERGAILSGEVWRLFSGHLVHLGWAHLGLNAAALVLIAALLGRLQRPPPWAWLALASSLGVSLGLMVCSPQVAWYVGLSGVSHGLVAAGGAVLARERRAAGFAWLALLAGKLAWEQLHGALPGSQAIIGAATVVDAHLYGAVAGLLGALLPGAVPGRRRRA